MELEIALRNDEGEVVQSVDYETFSRITGQLDDADILRAIREVTNDGDKVIVGEEPENYDALIDIFNV